MGQRICRSGIGAVRALAALPAANDALVLVLLQQAGVQGDDTLAGHATLAAMLSAGNREADFTNYTRLTRGAATSTWDAVNQRWTLTSTNPVWASAGNSLAPQQLAKLVICYQPDIAVGDDSLIAPLAHLDYIDAADGDDLNRPFAAAGWAQLRGTA